METGNDRNAELHGRLAVDARLCGDVRSVRRDASLNTLINEGRLH